MPIWSKSAPDASGNPASSVDDWALRFTVGDDYLWDRILLPYDVQATRGHVWGLAQIGVVTEAEHTEVEKGLDALLAAFEAGDVTVEPSDEDSHTVIEAFLTQRLGDVGRKIHTGRSRNDQVLAALRLYLRDALAGMAGQVASVAEGLCDVAEAQPDVLLPGYTHTQRAMPSTVALWALGFAETLVGDAGMLRDVRRQVNVSPLGSAAGYGVPCLDLPREAVAERLGFDGVQTHVTSVQMMRGKHELAVTHACVQAAATANRMASDLVLFASREFGFVDLPDAYCTGSSIMPQKKNPDVLELVRGSYHRVAGEMQTLATLPANLTSGYHRDLQLTKGALLRAVQTTRDVLSALEAVVGGLRFVPDATQAACTMEMLATQRALRQVGDGVPFRTAYRDAAQGTDGAGGSVTPEDVLDVYTTAGTPGNERPDAVRAQVASIRAWAGDAGA